MTHEFTAAEIREAIAHYEKAFISLLLAHKGVRPSWVSAELASIGATLNRWEAELKEMIEAARVQFEGECG